MSFLNSVERSANSLVRDGRYYSITLEVTLDQEEEGVLCLRTSDTPVLLETASLGTTSIETFVELREDVVFTDLTGSAIKSENRNRNLRDIPFPVDNSEADPVITDSGGVVEDFTVFGLSGSGSIKEVFSSGGSSIPYFLRNNTGYSLSFQNKDTGSRTYRVSLGLSF